ncbi:hypothetical protein ACFYPX_09175 [Micromonospora zamorensis]|uniref:hypothetical protein n=1 Tax=Micromonospora zamorensis TaxID=709883 RepID=UPI00367B980D
MRDGTKVTVRALTAMPGVEDGAVQHVEWGPRLVTLVDAGRYEVLEGGDAELAVTEPAATAAAGGEERGDSAEPTTTAAADGDSPRRTRRR